MSSLPPDLPDDIRAAARAARQLAALARRTPAQEAELNQARLKIAFYACRREDVPAAWDNLAFVLGRHADGIRPAFDQARRRRDAEENAESAPNAPPGSGPAGRPSETFWNDASARKRPPR